MRCTLVILAALTLPVLPAAAQQQDTLSTGLSSGLGSTGLSSGLAGGIGSGFSSGLVPETRRTLADTFNPDRQAVGGGCAPSQADPDHTGCRPTEWIRNEGRNPNRIITYTGDSAFRSSESGGSSDGQTESQR